MIKTRFIQCALIEFCPKDPFFSLIYIYILNKWTKGQKGILRNLQNQKAIYLERILRGMEVRDMGFKKNEIRN